VADRLRECASSANVWIGRDLHREDDGELYNGVGTLYACGSRLCPSCCAALARSSRRRARSAVVRLGRGDWNRRWRSLVLTMPLMRGADVTDAIGRINDSFRRLTNRSFWKTRVVGGIKSVEFTVRPDGYHVHIHLLVLSDYIPVNQEKEQQMCGYMERRKLAPGNLQAEMKHCLRLSGAEISGDLVLAVYDAKRQGERAKGEGITLESALQETCKYLTKSESWDKISDSQIVKIAEVERWPRMFELLGAARIKRDEVDAMGVEPEVERDVHGGTSLVHTHGLSNDEVARGEPVLGMVGLPGARAPSLRSLSVALDRSAWLQILSLRVSAMRAYRKAMLARRYPYAIFNSLAGDVWSA